MARRPSDLCGNSNWCRNSDLRGNSNSRWNSDLYGNSKWRGNCNLCMSRDQRETGGEKNNEDTAEGCLRAKKENRAICALPLTSPAWAAPPLHIEGGIFQLSHFLSAEALGKDMPRRCTSCLNCKVCKFRANLLTFNENQEYQVILDGLKYYEKRKKWTASHFTASPLGSDGQLQPGVQVHTVTREEAGKGGTS